jgi:hypothetical protein
MGEESKEYGGQMREREQGEDERKDREHTSAIRKH